MRSKDYFKNRREKAHKNYTLAEKSVMLNVEKYAKVIAQINKENKNGRVRSS